MRQGLKLFTILLIIAVLAACGSESSGNGNDNEAGADNNSADTSSLVFSTQGLGTTFNTMTNAINHVIKPELPEDLHIDTQTTSPGGIAASYIIAEGKADLTLGNAAPANWATTTGIEDKEKAEGVASLGGGYDGPIALAVFTRSEERRVGKECRSR